MDEQFPPEMMPEIEDFFSKVDKDLPYGQDLYPEVFDTGLFFPLQRQAELRQMMQTARAIEPVVVMEIGADKGGGLYHWCKCLPSVAAVIACEIRGTPYAAAFERAFPHIEFLWLPQGSLEPASLAAVDPFLKKVGKLDVLFIDGDKNAFAEDFDAYRPRMKKKSIVFMHDVTDSAPGAAYHACKERGDSDRIIRDISDYTKAKQRHDAGEPCRNAHEGWLLHWRGRSCSVGVIEFNG